MSATRREFLRWLSMLPGFVVLVRWLPEGAPRAESDSDQTLDRVDRFQWFDAKQAYAKQFGVKLDMLVVKALQ